ncbi:hypothetical protein HDU76_010955 [Blyttiomyces sp. JEL0837]|nr:hypothetical protein HDU76_010955 [Blyttiomyces sp. JEL0837]
MDSAQETMKTDEFPAALQSSVDALTTMYEDKVDGVSFSKFTAGIKKPFDSRLKDCMVLVAEELLSKFPALIAYHHSDEISLVFAAARPKPSDTYDDDGNPLARMEQGDSATTTTTAESETTESTTPPDQPRPSKKQKSNKHPQPETTHMYSGRMQKLASITASFASTRLNYHLAKLDWSDLQPQVQTRMKSHQAFFDGRVVPLPDLRMATSCLHWRAHFDGFRNAVSSIALAHYQKGKKTQVLHGKSILKQILMLQADGVDLVKEYGNRYLFGTFVKKELVSMEAVDPRTGKALPDPVVRKKVRSVSMNWADLSEEQRVKVVAAKGWPKEFLVGHVKEGLDLDSMMKM